MDLETAFDHDITDQRNILKTLCGDFNSIGFPISIFTTSESAGLFSKEVIDLKKAGNEICCHGYDHSLSENYSTMNEKQTSNLIKYATTQIENIIQDKVYSFRGPGFSTSTTTQKILVENGYKCDYSVCSQRLDFMNPIGGNIRWIFSPRQPYHPSVDTPFSKGDSSLWVIPLSSIGLPFISGLLYLFGLAFMKIYFQLLKIEAIRTGKPVVYLFHSYEFCRYMGHMKTGRTIISKTRANKKMLHRLYYQDHYERYINNLKLLEYILSFKDVQPFTANKYTEYLEENI